ncbi:MAG: alpha/beta hydrolase [Lysobacteraceae bacterium]
MDISGVPQIRRVQLHVQDTGGAGRPIVLIHGWPLSAESWVAQVPALHDAGFRVIAYDRRGFGRSEKPDHGYDYDTLADDLAGLVVDLDLHDAVLVGFSMGGGEVARYVSLHGQGRLGGVVFASAVTPCLMRSADNPQGPLTPGKAEEKSAGLKADRHAYFDEFTRNFFSVDSALQVDESQRQATIGLCLQSNQLAALACMHAFSTADFRDDLKRISIPTLVLHGDSDAVVPFEGSGALTHAAIGHSGLHLLKNAPHGCNTSHAEAFNAALLGFLRSC